MDIATLGESTRQAKVDARRQIRGVRTHGAWPTLVQSLDADDLATVPNGTALQKWGDRTGRGQDVLQPTSGSRPTVNVVNGRPEVVCASGQYLRSSSFAAGGWGQPGAYAQPLTICAVVRLPSSAASGLGVIAGGNTAAAGLALGMTSTNHFAALVGATGTLGASGGPALHDDQWHVVVGVFDTTRGYVMVDGVLVGATTSQAQGTATLTQLGVGAYADGTNARGLSYRRLDIYNGVLTPQQAAVWTAEMMQRWGLGTAPPQANVSWSDVTDAGGQSLRVFTPASVGPTVPVAILNHPQGGTTAVDQLYWFYPVVHALVARGFVVTYSNNHGADSWTNDSALTDVANARAYVNTNIGTVSGSLLVGASMGASLAMIAAKAGTLSDLKGVYMIDPAVNLAAMYANGYSTSINTAFGIASVGAIPSGKDPATLTGAQLPQGMRWRAVASTADTIAVKANNVDVVGPIIQAAAPAEYALVTHPDGHIGRGAALPADIDAFVKRCGFTGLVADLAA